MHFFLFSFFQAVLDVRGRYCRTRYFASNFSLMAVQLIPTLLLRYDHHQRGFEETLDDAHKTKLSSSGLVFKHFGRDALRAAGGGTVRGDPLFFFFFFFFLFVWVGVCVCVLAGTGSTF
jgi:hypothetical protein